MDTTLHIDYLSISTPTIQWHSAPNGYETPMDYYEQGMRACLNEYPSFVFHSLNGVKTDMEGDSGFKHRRHYSEFGWTLFGGASHGRFLINLPGEACHALRLDTNSEGESIGLRPILLEQRNRMTRIDLCANWRTSMTPDAMAAKFKSVDVTQHPRYPSSTGLTQWLSGLKSEQRCLTYRYEPPHPRSEWLRVEFRLFGNSAENLRQTILREGLLPPFLSLMNAKGFSDATMLNAVGIGIESQRIAYTKRQKAGSLRWLFGTALKSVRNAERTGILSRADILAYLDEDRF